LPTLCTAVLAADGVFILLDVRLGEVLDGVELLGGHVAHEVRLAESAAVLERVRESPAPPSGSHHAPLEERGKVSTGEETGEEEVSTGEGNGAHVKELDGTSKNLMHLIENLSPELANSRHHPPLRGKGDAPILAHI
jgi:hypothetical protein